jgi:hypothetical protein
MTDCTVCGFTHNPLKDCPNRPLPPIHTNGVGR